MSLKRHKHQRPASDRTPVYKTTIRMGNGEGFPVKEGDYIFIQSDYRTGEVTVELLRSKEKK